MDRARQVLTDSLPRLDRIIGPVHHRAKRRSGRPCGCVLESGLAARNDTARRRCSLCTIDVDEKRENEVERVFGGTCQVFA